MTKFIYNNVLNDEEVRKRVRSIDQEAVLAASAAIQQLVTYQHCDCGCPNQRKPASAYDCDLLRIAAFIRVELLTQDTAPGN
jgi:hypothetical protein